MKTGLVLEGGAMRGIYTAGVLDVFMEQNIVVDGVIGVSAGAVHGASYVSGQHGRNIRYTKKYCNDWRFMSVRSFLTTGSMVGTQFSYEELPYHLDPFDFDRFIHSNIKFYAGMTNLETGKAEYLCGQDENEERCLDIIRASASMPVVSQPVTIDGKQYLDGGTGDSVPLQAFQKMGYEKNIVVLTRPAGYRKMQTKLMSVIRRQYAQYPEYISASEHRYIYYNETLRRLENLEQEGNTLIIRPSRAVKVHRAEKDPDVLQTQYDLGRLDAMMMLERIKDFLRTSADGTEL
jgi:predicted patatin/cPLA2 family phospholipase